MDLGLENLIKDVNTDTKLESVLDSIDTWVELAAINDEASELTMMATGLENLGSVLDLALNGNLNDATLSLVGDSLQQVCPEYTDMSKLSVAHEGMVGTFVRKTIDAIKRLAEWIIKFFKHIDTRITTLETNLREIGPGNNVHLDKNVGSVTALLLPYKTITELPKNMSSIMLSANYDALFHTINHNTEPKATRDGNGDVTSVAQNAINLLKQLKSRLRTDRSTASVATKGYKYDTLYADTVSIVAATRGYKQFIEQEQKHTLSLRELLLKMGDLQHALNTSQSDTSVLNKVSVILCHSYSSTVISVAGTAQAQSVGTCETLYKIIKKPHVSRNTDHTNVKQLA